MGATMTTVDAILKEIYGPRIVDQLQNEAVAIKRLEKSSDGVIETVGGKYVNFPLKVGRNHGQGYRNENEALPAAGQQKYNEVTVGLKYGYGRVRLTGQVMSLADKNYQAFASAMDREMEGIKNDIAKDTNRIAYGDSTGVIANGTASASANTHEFADVSRVEVGMVVDVLVRATGVVKATNRTVTAVDYDANTVTFDGAAFALLATEGIYREGSYGREPNGLGNIISDTLPLHGLDPATQPLWASIIKDNGGTNRALSEGLMIETADEVRQNGGKVSLILGSLGVRRAYFNLLTQQRRYADTKSFDGGFTGLAFNYGTEIPMVEDPDAPVGVLHFLDEKALKIYQSKDWHWAQDDGNVLKWVTGYDAWEGVLRKYWEIGCERRNTQAKLVDITEG